MIWQHQFVDSCRFIILFKVALNQQDTGSAESEMLKSYISEMDVLNRIYKKSLQVNMRENITHIRGKPVPAIMLTQVL